MPNNNSSTLIYGTVVAVILAVIPYLFYSYEAVPESLWDISFLKSVNESLGGDAYITTWLITLKLVPALLFFIWFLTCKHWWYHVIIIPFSMYFFQLVSVFLPDVEYIDHNEIYFIIPVVIGSLSASYLARIKVFDKIHGIDISEIEEGVRKPSDRFFS
ncbi:hypothetical protein FNJ87_02335 [Nonlabens mediterrranea]|uniref:Uncharacterized protein n=1 Tax=Nonlabens mediterrranea TaxID=1419947 RepID=A0ABS0A1F9_9FLAO|nr:hypothetical protein BBFL7_00024 [Flavobacteria bacterium BBFL7]MBF4983220.1 hypothetical protein [Nonlabens mediterrranea]